MKVELKELPNLVGKKIKLKQEQVTYIGVLKEVQKDVIILSAGFSAGYDLRLDRRVMKEDATFIFVL